jgi:hypothetical protein
LVSHHGQASELGDKPRHHELWPAYNLNAAPPQAPTEGLFQQTHPLSRVPNLLRRVAFD